MLDPEGIVSFMAGDEAYRLFFGMRAMKEIERHYDKAFMLAIQSVMPQLSAEDMADKAKLIEASSKVRLSDVAKLFEFGLAKHHPDLSEDDVDGLIDDIGVARASELLGDALAASLGAGEADEDAPKNPPKRSRANKTGSRS
ncbi:MAG: hypothetical protein V4696_01455 [Pseudomonadota bacterium]